MSLHQQSAVEIQKLLEDYADSKACKKVRTSNAVALPLPVHTRM